MGAWRNGKVVGAVNYDPLRVVENLDGNAEEREVDRQVCAAKGESEEMEIDETDEDIGADADVEDEEIAPLQEEQREQVERSGTAGKR